MKALLIIGIIVFIIWYSKIGKNYCHCTDLWGSASADKVRFKDRRVTGNEPRIRVME